MKLRIGSTGILLLATLLLGAFIFLFEHETQSTDTHLAESRRAFRFSPSEVMKVRVECGGMTLLCEKEADQWQIRSPVRDRANSALVERFLNYLELLRKSTSITPAEREKSGVNLSHYGLDNPAARIALQGHGLDKTYDIGYTSLLGKSVYMRETNGLLVFPVDAEILDLIPASPTAWRSSELFPDNFARVVRVGLRRQDGFIQLARQEGDSWVIQQPIKARAASMAVPNLFDRLESIQIADFISENGDVSSAQMFDASPVELLLWFGAESSPQTLQIGREIPQRSGCHYARWTGKESIYAITNDILPLLQTPLQNLRDKQLTPPLYALTVRQVVLDRGEAEIELRKTENDSWWIVKPYLQPADDSRVEDLIESWCDAVILRFVADQVAPSNTPLYGLDAPLARIQLSAEIQTNLPAAPEDAKGIVLDVSSLPAGNDGLLVGTADKSVYAVSPELLRSLNPDPLHYRDRDVLRIPRDQILRIRLALGDQTASAVRDNPEMPFTTPETDNPIEPAALEALLRLLVALQAERFVVENPKDTAKYGLDTPYATLILNLTGTEGIGKTLLIGSESGVRPTRYAMLLGQDIVFELDDPAVEIITHPVSGYSAGNRSLLPSGQ